MSDVYIILNNVWIILVAKGDMKIYKPMIEIQLPHVPLKSNWTLGAYVILVDTGLKVWFLIVLGFRGR